MSKLRLLTVVTKFANKIELFPKDMLNTSSELRVMVRRAGVPLLWITRTSTWVISRHEEHTDEYLSFVANRCYSYLLTTYLALKDTRLSQIRCSQLLGVLRVLGQLAGRTDSDITDDLGFIPEPGVETDLIKEFLILMEKEPDAA